MPAPSRKLRRLLSGTALLVLVSFSAAGASAPPQWALTDLGRLPHITDDIAPGLSANGSVAAWTAKPGGFQGDYTGGGSIRCVAISLPDKDILASDVSSEGEVVGLAKDPRDLRFTQAFSWSREKITLLPSLGGRFSSALAVNPAGLIVGGADLSGDLHHACLWRNGAAHDLGTLPGGDYSIADGLNAAGEIVGESNAAANGKSQAVLWHNGRITALSLLPGGSVSAARAINAQGESVGWGDIYGGSVHAVLWRGVKATDLGTLSDDPAAAWSINDAGQVVGSSAVGPNKMHAFFWQRGQMSDLNDLVASKQGWSLEAAYRISNRGWILGMGRFHGWEHLYLLRPVTARRKVVTADKKTNPHV